MAELRTLRIAVNDHMPRYSEGFGERWIDCGTAALRKINYCNPVGIERPSEGSSKGMNEKILGHAFNHDPAPCEENLPACSSAMKPESFFVLCRGQYAATVAQMADGLRHSGRIRLTAIATRRLVARLTSNQHLAATRPLAASRKKIRPGPPRTRPSTDSFHGKSETM